MAKIRRGDAAVHVTPRAMAVLVHLAEARGAVVGRNTILDAVWPRMSVTPDALARCLVELRKAFGEGQQVIETIPKVGLRLTLPVVIDDGEAPVPGALRAPISAAAWRWRFARRSAAAAAVAALCAGVLAWYAHRVPAPEASADPEARAYYASALDYAQRSNRVDALQHQEGLYRRAVEEDPQFALAWVGLGRTHLGLYWYALDRTPARLELAEQALRRAVALQHDLPDVHLALADFYFKARNDSGAALAELAAAERGFGRTPDPELYFVRSTVQRRLGALRDAAAAGERSVELDPGNLVYRRQLHLTYVFLRDFARAERVLDDILLLYPDDGTTYVDKAAIAMQARGDASLVDAYDGRPPTVQYDDGLAYAYVRWLGAIMRRDYGRALSVLAREGEQIFNGDLRTTVIPRAALVARTHRLAGDSMQAAAEFARVARDIEAMLATGGARDESSAAALQLTLAEARAALGRREEALASLRQALDLVPKSADAIVGSAVQLAAITRVLVPAGETTAALRELDDYLARPGHWGIDGLLADPQLAPLWGEPGAAALIAKYRDPELVR